MECWNDPTLEHLACCPHPLRSVPYLCVPSLPSQPQEGPGSPKHWYYLCAPHLRPPLCRNLAHPTKGNRWCTTVHGMTSVSVGRQLMVNNVAGARHAPQRRNQWEHPLSMLEWNRTIFSQQRALIKLNASASMKALRGSTQDAIWKHILMLHQDKMLKIFVHKEFFSFIHHTWKQLFVYWTENTVLP